LQNIRQRAADITRKSIRISLQIFIGANK